MINGVQTSQIGMEPSLTGPSISSSSSFDGASTLQVHEEGKCGKAGSCLSKVICFIPRKVAYAVCWIITKLSCGRVNLIGYDAKRVWDMANELSEIWQNTNVLEEKQEAWQKFLASCPKFAKELDCLYLLYTRNNQLHGASTPQAIETWNKEIASVELEKWHILIEACDDKVTDRIVTILASKFAA